MENKDITQPRRILIVDDEPHVATALADSLEALGEQYLIEVATSGEKAIAKLQQSSYDLVITDYLMPDINGLDLIQTIHRDFPDTKIILMTAYGTTDLRHTTQEMDIAGYLDKPVAMPQIRELVRQVVERARDGADPYRSGQRTVDQAASKYLRELQINTGARCVLLLSSSGYIVEVAGQTSALDVTSLGALIAANFAAAAEVAHLLGNVSVFKTSYYEGPDYNFYAYDVNGDLLLAVIFGTENKPGMIWLYTKRAAAALADHFGKNDPSDHADLDENIVTAVGHELEQIFSSNHKP